MSRMIRMFINDEEVVSNLQFTIVEEMLKASSTILNNCYPKIWENDHDYVSRFYFPPDYSKCVIMQEDDFGYHTIFDGVVKNTGNISLNPRQPHYSALQILGFKTLLSEGETLDFVISNKTVSEAIEMIVNVIKDYGFELGEIEILNDSVIGAYSTLNKTPYDVFQYLANVSQTRWKTRRTAEGKIAIDFYDPSLLPQKPNIEYTQEYFDTNNIDDMKFSYSTNDYRNKQIMLSNEVYGNIPYIQSITADGYNKTFMTENNIAKINSVKVNGAEVEVITKDDKQIGVSGDIFYEPGKNEIETNDIYTAGTIIVVDYIPLIKGRQLIVDNNEIDRITNQISRKGVISRYETRNDVLSSDELEAIGQSYLKFKGTAEIKLTIKTHNKDLFDIGDVSYFDAPIENLQHTYMCKKKKTTIITSTQDIFYEYELTNNYNSESEINYFDNQRAKANGNISAGDYIDRNIDVFEETNIIYRNLNITSSDVENDNVLNCALNSPFIK